MEKKITLIDLKPEDAYYNEVSLIEKFDIWTTLEESSNYLWKCLDSKIGKNAKCDVMLFLNITFRFINYLKEEYPKALDILEEEFENLLNEARNGKKINS